MKKAKLTKKQEKFVDLMVYHDYTQTECAHLAGYANPGVAASVMLSDPKYEYVRERIRELKAIQRKKNEITFEKIANKLSEIRDRAIDDGSYGPAVAAEVARAKLAGLMVDKKEYKIHKIDSMSREQLELRLNELMQENQMVIEAKVKDETADKSNGDLKDSVVGEDPE